MHSKHFLDSLSIFDIWHQLGGGEIRHRRSRAFWRDGDGWSVSIDADRNIWYDFVAGEGGGILDLVQHVLSCDRISAIQGTADYAGVPQEHWSPAQHRDYGRRRAAAEAEADELIAFRELMVDALAVHRDVCLHLYHCDKRAILQGDYRSDAELVQLMDECEFAEQLYTEDDAALDVWRNATWKTILRTFRQRRSL